MAAGRLGAEVGHLESDTAVQRGVVRQPLLRLTVGTQLMLELVAICQTSTVGAQWGHTPGTMGEVLRLPHTRQSGHPSVAAIAPT